MSCHAMSGHQKSRPPPPLSQRVAGVHHPWSRAGFSIPLNLPHEPPEGGVSGQTDFHRSSRITELQPVQTWAGIIKWQMPHSGRGSAGSIGSIGAGAGSALY